MRFLLFFISVLLSHVTFAGKIMGVVSDDHHRPLPFSSIIIQGTGQGTSSNNEGRYTLLLPAGQYVLTCQHIGYKSDEQKIPITGDETIVVDFRLAEQQYQLPEVTIRNGEDPAYAIIRNAIKKRPFHQDELKNFQSEVYIKGQFKFRDFPDRFMGQKVDFEDGDTSKRKIVFLSETVAHYSVFGKQRKIEILSTRVSGDKDGFGFSNPQIISFYSNNISISTLNPRGFISPISDNALHFYNYRFEGNFFENGYMINKIRVTPKRKFEPLFSGFVNIIETQWRLHSLQLNLYRENQIQLADTVRIEQLYVPFGNVWVIKQQTIYPSINILGFTAAGAFVQVYDKFDADPVFPRGFFDNTVLKIYDSANKKPPVFWDSIRPVLLLAEEKADYITKDSIENLANDPVYSDSVRRARNKPNVMALLTTGQTFTNEQRRSSVRLDALPDVINFNTVEGAVVNLSPTFTRRFNENGRKSLRVTPNFRYGFATKRFNAHISATYSFGKDHNSSLSVSGGRRIFQIDNASPVAPRTNTFSTLLWENNLLKLYEATFARLNFSQDIGSGLRVGVGAEFQERRSLRNHTLHKWRDIEDRAFTENIVFQDHTAFTGIVNLTWQPGAKYIELPDARLNIGSKYPTFNLHVVNGFKGPLKSDVDFTRWKLTTFQKVDLKLAGRFDYRLSTGGFLRRSRVYIPDYTHYFGNQSNTAAPYLNSFQLMPFYSFSNMEKWYGAVHTEYHLNGLLTNKVPVFKKLNWFLVTGTNLLFVQNNKPYSEAFIGLENIFKIIRIDFVQSFSAGSVESSSGIRFSLPGFLRGEQE